MTTYFCVISVTALVLFACDFSATSDSAKLELRVRNTGLGYSGKHSDWNTYNYSIYENLELECGGSERLHLEWTDERNNISLKSCSKIRKFILKLDNLGKDDHQSTFRCTTNSTNENVTLTFFLKNKQDFRTKENNENKCYNISRYMENICTLAIHARETVYRKQISCPTPTKIMRDPIILTNTEDMNSSTNKYHVQHLDTGERNTKDIPLYVGVVAAAFITLAIIAFCIYKCFKKIKERKTDENIYEEPNLSRVEYAELQVVYRNPPQLPTRNDPPYARIIGVLTSTAPE